jgi:cilia- and flagella-associated protein 300
VCTGSAAKTVTAEPISCSVLSMDYFDRLYNNEIVRESGHIVKCFDDYYEDFIISDKLREVAGIARVVRFFSKNAVLRS